MHLCIEAKTMTRSKHVMRWQKGDGKGIARGYPDLLAIGGTLR